MLSLVIAAGLCARALRAGMAARQLAMLGSGGMLLTFVALALVFTFARSAPLAFSVAVMPLGLGLGLLFPLVGVLSQQSTEPRHVGIFTATPLMLRALGGALGLAVLGTCSRKEWPP
jgi:hypothetical protein